MEHFVVGRGSLREARERCGVGLEEALLFGRRMLGEM